MTELPQMTQPAQMPLLSQMIQPAPVTELSQMTQPAQITELPSSNATIASNDPIGSND